MSGGHFDYNQHIFHSIASDIQYLIDTNEDSSKNEWGDTVGKFYSNNTIEQFNKAVKLLNGLGDLVHEIDYLISGDTSEETFLERTKPKQAMTDHEYFMLLAKDRGVYIHHNNELGRWVWSVAVEGTDYWLESFKSYELASSYVNEAKLTFTKLINDVPKSN